MLFLIIFLQLPQIYANMMKNFSLGVGGLMLVVIFLMICLFTVPPHVHHASIHGKATKFGDDGKVEPEHEGIGVKEVVEMELYPTGSSLPDCSHACGPCFPCRRVIVSSKCSTAESCPIVYKCMCKGKYYPVPSN